MQWSTIMTWLVSALSGILIIYFWALIDRRHATQAVSQYDTGADGATRFSGGHWFLRYFGWLIELIGEFIGLLPIAKRRAKRQQKLIRAGMPGDLNADEFEATRIVACILLFLVGMFMDNELDMWPTLTGAFVILGIVYPDIWLEGYISKRRRRIFRDLPDLLDILRLAMDAGLDFGSAMGVVVEKGRDGPLLREMEKIERDMALGRTRQEALREFAERISMSEINAFVLALIQADQLGASIAPVLRAQSEMARKRRWQLAEELVNKLPMKMLGPLVVFIFPASFIILFTPLLIQYLQE
ncbi:MAG: type II secretion system F family protein [Bdellovibrionales bacterium]|nr:type II secretion system F family protein [Bdellovibrionales bacterium]